MNPAHPYRHLVLAIACALFGCQSSADGPAGPGPGGECTPSCDGKSCGDSDSCGGTCDAESCDSGQRCERGACVCDATSCSGCCAAGKCVDGSQEDACGGGGDACMACSATAACVSNSCQTGHLVVFGGDQEPGGIRLGDTWTFDGTSWKKITGPGPSARFWATMATLGNKVVLFGGYGGVNGQGQAIFLNDTWTFDGTSWTHVPASGPVGRYSAAMTTLGNKVLLVGGTTYMPPAANVTVLKDAWTFDGTSWTQVAGLDQGRTGHVMASLGNTAVLSGGQTSSANKTDTLTFDGTSWTTVAGAGTGASVNSAMTTLDGKIVLFRSSATLTFDGATWTQVPGAGPSERSLPGLATFGSKAVLFGGGTYDDTWTFDGTTWTKLAIAGPPKRQAPMAWLPL